MTTVELTDEQKKSLPCFQNPGPWQDSTDLPVLKWAARQCQTRCSFQDWCNSQRLSTLNEFNTATGVWAGQIYTHRGVFTSGSSPNRVILPDQDHAL